ncbi:MAG: GNAT family N-acetyltransferase [Candidatus Thorarchaeota archaeon]|nr:GNAT family N-acetyltransferase [Candidatus Thorarchaeota archaeon]
MTIEVRQYQPADRPFIEEIIISAENFGEMFLDHEMQMIDISEKFPDYIGVIVAVDSENEEVIGFATLRFEWRTLIINTIITHHEHLRKGVGSVLIKKIIEMGEAHPKINVVQVDTGDFMVYAQKFYLANGFKVSGYATHFLGWHNNQIIYTRPLKKVSE